MKGFGSALGGQCCLFVRYLTLPACLNTTYVGLLGRAAQHGAHNHQRCSIEDNHQRSHLEFWRVAREGARYAIKPILSPSHLCTTNAGVFCPGKTHLFLAGAVPPQNPNPTAALPDPRQKRNGTFAHSVDLATAGSADLKRLHRHYQTSRCQLQSWPGERRAAAMRLTKRPAPRWMCSIRDSRRQASCTRRYKRASMAWTRPARPYSTSAVPSTGRPGSYKS